MRLAWMLLVTTACGSKSSQPAPIVNTATPDAAIAATPAPEPAAPAPREEELPPPPPPKTGPVVAIEGDIDGVAGNEAITLAADGTLTAGAAKIVLKFDRPELPDGYVKLEVVPLGGKRRGVMITSATEGEEDPPDRHRIYFYDGGKLELAFDEVLSVSKIEFAPSGVGKYLEAGWTACTREQKGDKPVKKARRLEVSLKLVGKKLVATKKPSKEVQNCDELAACPYVYEVVAGTPRLIGEILRNVRGAEMATRQSLWLGTGEGPTTVRLAEEKPEVTYLDEIYLEVDGVPVAPRACATDPTLAYCSADGRHHVMRQGDVLPLEFEASAGKRSLIARGYYVPTPAAP